MTGATGFIGGTVARQLRDRGDDVVCLVRSPEKAGKLTEIGCQLISGDLADRDAMDKLPQTLVNVRLTDRTALDAAVAATADEVASEHAALSGRGRVLVRASGTEPLVRVMVEAPTAEEAEAVCARLAGAVEAAG